MRLRRVSATIMTLVLSFSMVPAAALGAEAHVTMAVSEDTVDVGDTFTVIVGNTDMTVASIASGISFDTGALEVVSITGTRLQDDSEEYDKKAYLQDEDDYYEVTAFSSKYEARANGVVSYSYAGTEDREYLESDIFIVTFEAKKTGTTQIVSFEDSIDEDNSAACQSDAVEKKKITIVGEAADDSDEDNDDDNSGGNNNGGNSGGNSGNGSSKPSSGTDITTNEDGSIVVVETEKDGTVTTTTIDPSGTTVESVTTADGATETKVTISEETAENNEKVMIPASTNETLKVDLPEGVSKKDPVVIAVPIENISAGTVAVIVYEDGTEEVVRKSIVDGNTLLVPVSDSATIRFEDKSKTFADTADHWGESAIDYVTSRELFSGTDVNQFSPDTPMTRAMLMTVLARYDGQQTGGGEKWFEKGMDWAKDVGISDGTSPHNNVTREQLVSMLYRFAKMMDMDVSVGENTNILSYHDVFEVEEYAIPAMQWACGVGIISGSDGYLDPKDNATRVQVASMLQRFSKYSLQ